LLSLLIIAAGIAADAILDGGTEELNTFVKVVAALKSRFGTEGQTDKFREELRARRQTDNETLQSLYADIQQLTIKAFPRRMPTYVTYSG
jgi:hypothetical protein